MPMAVFLVGTGFGTESYSPRRMANMVVITIGVAIAAYGELNFVLVRCDGKDHCFVLVVCTMLI